MRVLLGNCSLLCGSMESLVAIMVRFGGEWWDCWGEKKAMRGKAAWLGSLLPSAELPASGSKGSRDGSRVSALPAPLRSFAVRIEDDRCESRSRPQCTPRTW